MDFARILKDIRLKRKMTQQEMADLLHITRTTVSLYENGRHTPDIRSIQRYAEILEVTPERLLFYRNSKGRNRGVDEEKDDKEKSKEIYQTNSQQ